MHLAHGIRRRGDIERRQLTGKVAIVTGASKGIGAALAKGLAAAGAAVAVNYAAGQEGAERTVSEITSHGGQAIAIQADISKAAEVKRMFEATKNVFGSVDVLVNNAGVFQFEPFDAITEQEFHREFDINVLGSVLAIQEAVKHFPASGGFQWLIVSNDPERTFNDAADHIIYQANNYTTWLAKAGLMPKPVYLRDREQLRQSGLLKVVQPDTAITMIRDYISEVPVTHYYAWTLPPGLPPRWAQAHLELFASKVIPAFR
jgi:short-subunit dehydrogenase involved in D-alanine esterification of teichoic acids